jgi:O-antigen ligase
MDEGRLSGTFKDANVLGSYLILSLLFLVQAIVLGATRRIFLSLLGCMAIAIAIFLSFSRGSWGATVVALLMMTAMSFLTAKNRRERRRIVKVAAAVLALGVLAILIVLANPATRDMLVQRASLLHSYDVGETGRFGNQLRSLPMLLELPNGFGPLRFRLIFGLEPHNSYINAFASYGWLGGFAWLIIVGMTMWIGFRLCFSPSPYRRFAQVYWPALFVLLLQGFQIDIDHWRQLFLCFGAIWGMEAARLKWLRGRAPSLPADGEAIRATIERG